MSVSDAPLADVASAALGSKAGVVLSLISLASTASTVLVLLLASTRILHTLSCEKVLPEAVCRITPGGKTPWPAISIIALIAIAVAAIKSIEDTAQFTNFLTLAAFIGVNASLIRIFRNERASRTRRILLNRVLPVLAILTAAGLAVNTGLLAIGLGAAVIGVGMAVQWLMGRGRGK